MVGNVLAQNGNKPPATPLQARLPLIAELPVQDFEMLAPDKGNVSFDDRVVERTSNIRLAAYATLKSHNFEPVHELEDRLASESELGTGARRTSTKKTAHQRHEFSLVRVCRNAGLEV